MNCRRKWPNLTKVALQLESQPCSEGDAERHFKGVALQQPKERASLGVERTGKVAFCREEILSELARGEDEALETYTPEWVEKMSKIWEDGDPDSDAPPPPPTAPVPALQPQNSGNGKQRAGPQTTFDSGEAMQEAVHNEFGYGKAPTPGEWDALLEADFSIKAELFEAVAQHPEWFFGDKLKNLKDAVYRATQ